MDWEILDSFFQNYNLTPHFFDNNFTWGWYDEEIGSYYVGMLHSNHLHTQYEGEEQFSRLWRHHVWMQSREKLGYSLFTYIRDAIKT